MRAFSKPLAVIATMTLLASGCGGTEPAPPSGASGSASNVDVTFKSEPDPPKMGENTFEVMVMSGGQPVTDADVAVEFFMPAMPAMNMAEMRNSVPLAHDSGGRYRGTGNVMMSGSWDATVTVKRGGQLLGSEKFPVTAK
jgi:hypothetical protein